MATVGLAVGAILMGASAARAQDDAAKILKAMSDYVTSQKTIAITFDSDIEVMTLDLQKIQFTTSGQVLLSRPDKLRASRTGGYADIELVFDGKTFTLNDRDKKTYVQSDGAGSIDHLVDKLRAELGVDAPGADLLLSDPFAVLTEDAIDGRHIGPGVIDGVECEHLAFRGHESDWQIWIEVGTRPIPRKYVITNKAVTGAPQYTLRIKEWRTDPQIAADTFAFKPAAGAKKVDIKELAPIDEVPPGVVAGGKK